MTLFRFSAVLLAGALWVTVGHAAAETCPGTLRTEALEALQQPVRNEAELQAAMTQIDGFLARCPADPWINALGADLDLRVFNMLVAANNNQMDQQAFDFLQRAFVRSTAFQDAPPAARADVYAVQTRYGGANLTYPVAAANRKSIIEVMMGMARLGSVHPYLQAETPKTCTGWLTSDTQTIGYALETEADLVLLAFIDAAAEACRGEASDPVPLAVASLAYMRLVQNGSITASPDVSRALQKARDYRDAYLSRRGFNIYYSQSDSDRLDGELRKRKVDPLAGLVAREQWFTPEHFGSEKMQFSVAWAASEEWAALSEKMALEGIDLPAAGSQYARFFYDVLTQAGEAGRQAETQAVLRRALSDVQQGRVRAWAMADYDLPPEWLHGMIARIVADPSQAGAHDP
jgi:hypothetical protein